MVYEIDTAKDWGELVSRYPLCVTKARRQDWWRATGQDHARAIPNYPAVAADYDAIHLTVGGYLSTAGRPIGAGSTHTVLAGWDPDQTWWLTDSSRRLDEPVTWLDTGEEEPFMWAPKTQCVLADPPILPRTRVPFVAVPATMEPLLHLASLR